MGDRLYCTLAEIEGDLGKLGSKTEADLLGYIRSASDFLDNPHRLGMMIPITATRRFDGNGRPDLRVPPLLSVTSIVDDGDTLATTDYLLYPRNRLWENGPYIRISIDPDSPSRSVWTKERDIVVISGLWGLYQETSALGFNGTQTDASVATLAATNGALLSAGMVLLIESEQELVLGRGTPTAATSLVNGAIAAGDESITVDNGAEFFEGEVIRIDLEDMKILKINTHTLYVQRQYNGTLQVAHNNDAAISVYRTYSVKRGINGTTAAAHSNKAVSRYPPPSDVNWLCRQIAGLMKKKAESAFAGKTGNVELGEVFYNNEFPDDPIKKIKANYRVPSL